MHFFFKFLKVFHVHVKSQFREKKISYFPGMQQCYNTLLSNFPTIICQGVAFGRLKETVKTFSSESGRGRLREVVAYERFQIE